MQLVAEGFIVGIMTLLCGVSGIMLVQVRQVDHILRSLVFPTYCGEHTIFFVLPIFGPSELICLVILSDLLQGWLP